MQNKYKELQKQINQKLLKSNGRLNRYAYEKYPDLIKEVFKITSFLKEESSVKERVYCIRNFIFKQPTCELCKKLIQYKKGYANTCSIKCSNILISRNSAKKRSETLKINSRDDSYKIVLDRFNEMNKTKMYELISINTDLKQISFKCLKCGEINEKTFINFNHYTYCTAKSCKVKRMNNNFKNPEILKQCKQTKLEKYGDENYSNRAKYKETNLKKYGETHHMKSEKFKAKYKKKNLEKFYNTKIVNLPSITPLFSLEQYKGVAYVYEWQCKKCSHIFKGNLSSGKTPVCRMCNPTQYTSKLELEIREWLLNFFDKKDLKVNWRSNKEGQKFEIDILIELKKIGIELNGVYWHSELGGMKDKRYHRNKSDFYKKYFDYQIIHIWDNEWINKPDLIKSMLKSKLGIIENKIYARQCEIKLVNNKDKKQFLNNNHLQGKDSSSVKLGLYYNNELVSLLTLGKSRFNKKYDYEIIRYCNLLNYIIVGGFSKLFKYFIRNYKFDSIITYADYRYSNGNLYLKNGFSYSHTSNPNYYYTSDYKILENRVNYQKHKLKDKLPDFKNELSEWENMKNNKFDRIWDCGNLVFEYKG